MPGRTQYGMPSNPWRDKYQQASFRGAIFYTESDSRSSGRRVAVHQYPKRDTPYSEDLGRRAVQHPITGYLIGPDYIGPRDDLIDALEKEGPGQLIHPLLKPMQVLCTNYTVTESRERGGYCSFEMMFVEAGSDAGTMPTQSTSAAASQAANSTSSAATARLNAQVSAFNGGN
jgi:prophage DNA circulation protein